MSSYVLLVSSCIVTSLRLTVLLERHIKTKGNLVVMLYQVFPLTNNNTTVVYDIVLCSTELQGDHVAQKPIRQILQWGFLHYTERK